MLSFSQCYGLISAKLAEHIHVHTQANCFDFIPETARMLPLPLNTFISWTLNLAGLLTCSYD